MLSFFTSVLLLLASHSYNLIIESGGNYNGF